KYSLTQRLFLCTKNKHLRQVFWLSLFCLFLSIILPSTLAMVICSASCESQIGYVIMATRHGRSEVKLKLAWGGLRSCFKKNKKSLHGEGMTVLLRL
ncbi:hypothetical protein QQP08_006978, partial [Theobroma cacao]